MIAGLQAGHGKRLALFLKHADGLTVDENFNLVQVGLEGQRAVPGGRRRGGLGGGWRVGQQQVGVEAAAVGSGILLSPGFLADLRVDVLGQLVGAHHAVAIGVGGAAHSLHHVVSEDAVAAVQIGTLEGTLAVAAGGEREQRCPQVRKRVVQRGRLFRRDGAAMASVRQEDLVSGVYLVSDHGAQLVHGIAGGFDARGIEIRRRQVSFAPVEEAVAREVDEHAVAIPGDRRQPLVDFAPHGGQRGLRTGEDLDVLRLETAAFRADQDRVHGLRVAFREPELELLGELGIARDADHHGVTARRRLGRWRRRGGFGVQLFHFEVALPVRRRRLLGKRGNQHGGGCGEKDIPKQHDSPHLCARRNS